jgi:hypothetical protein
MDEVSFLFFCKENVVGRSVVMHTQKVYLIWYSKISWSNNRACMCCTLGGAIAKSRTTSKGYTPHIQRLHTLCTFSL